MAKKSMAAWVERERERGGGGRNIPSWGGRGGEEEEEEEEGGPHTRKQQRKLHQTCGLTKSALWRAHNSYHAAAIIAASNAAHASSRLARCSLRAHMELSDLSLVRRPK